MTRTQTQSEKFKQAARELGCNDDEKRFTEALKKIGQSPPPKADKKDEGEKLGQ